MKNLKKDNINNQSQTEEFPLKEHCKQVIVSFQ